MGKSILKCQTITHGNTKVKLTLKQEQRIAKDNMALYLYQARHWLNGTYSKQYPEANKIKEASECLSDALRAFEWVKEVFT